MAANLFLCVFLIFTLFKSSLVNAEIYEYQLVYDSELDYQVIHESSITIGAQKKSGHFSHIMNSTDLISGKAEGNDFKFTIKQDGKELIFICSFSFNSEWQGVWLDQEDEKSGDFYLIRKKPTENYVNKPRSENLNLTFN